MSKPDEITRREFFKRTGKGMVKATALAAGLEGVLSGCSPKGIPIYTPNNGYLTSEGTDFLNSLNDGAADKLYSFTPGFANFFNVLYRRLVGKEISKTEMVRFKGSLGSSMGEHTHGVSCKNGNIKIYGLSTLLDGQLPGEVTRTLLHEYTHAGHSSESVPCYIENLGMVSIPFIFQDVPEVYFDRKASVFNRAVGNIRASVISGENEGFHKYTLPDLITLLVLNEVLMDKNAKFGDMYYAFEKNTLHFHLLAQEFIKYSEFRQSEEVTGVFGPSNYKDSNGNLINYPEITTNAERSHFNLSATLLGNIVIYQLMKNHLDNGTIGQSEFDYAINMIKASYLNGSLVEENSNKVITIHKYSPRIIKPGFAEEHPLIKVPEDYDQEFLM